MLKVGIDLGGTKTEAVILDPDQIVLGGGVSHMDELYTLGIERVRKNVFKENPEIRISKNQLGDSAGVIGAALLHGVVH